MDDGLTMFGIRNCDTVKKARMWLDTAGIAFVFHDYKRAGVAADHVARWVSSLGWETVLNRSGTTFRKLPDADRVDIDAARAMALMLEQPSMIRRPIIEGMWGGRPVLLAGFRADDYAVAFGTD